MHNIILDNDKKVGINIHYSFRDIQEEVFKRTSMLSRGENAVHYNELVLSKGEEFIFSPYLVDIASELYDFISPFCKDETTGFYLSDSINTICSNDSVTTESAREDIEYRFAYMDWFNERAISMLDVSIFESLVNGIIWQWLSIFGETELSNKYKWLYDRAVVNMRNRLNSQNKPVRRKYNLF